MPQREGARDLVQHAFSTHQLRRASQCGRQHRSHHGLADLSGARLLLAGRFGRKHQAAQFVGGRTGANAVSGAKRVAAVVPGRHGGSTVTAQIEDLHAQAVGLFHRRVTGQHGFGCRQGLVQRAGVQVFTCGSQLQAPACARTRFAPRLQPLGKLRGVVEFQRAEQAPLSLAAAAVRPGQGHGDIGSQLQHAAGLRQQNARRTLQADQGLAQIRARLPLVPGRPQQPRHARAGSGLPGATRPAGQPRAPTAAGRHAQRRPGGGCRRGESWAWRVERADRVCSAARVG